MSQLVVLNLGKGNCQQGCPTVTAQLWEAESYTPMQFLGSLPPAPELSICYERWQHLYEALYAHKSWRRQSPTASLEIEIDEAETEVTHISEAEFHTLCRDVQQGLNAWLNDLQFRSIDRQIRTHLVPGDEIRCVIVAEDQGLLRLPWCLWQVFEDYPRIELALSLPEYTRTVKTSVGTGEVKILAILGNRQGIDVTQDQQLLQQLPHAAITLLVEPNLQQLSQRLWEQPWDMLFFAGHSSSHSSSQVSNQSSSQGSTQKSSQSQGCIQINATESLTIDQIRYGLKRAIANGLKLAIFNSCDGLGLAWDLADLQIPQVIVMREPVPDRVAQEFLKQFLLAFTHGQSLYRSVREAREKLQALEAEFPCATWLPVICQNPAELPQTWEDWRGIASKSKERQAERQPPARASRRKNWHKVLLGSLAVTSCLMGIRSLGILQPSELWAFDRLLTLRPSEPPDDRLLLVTIDEADIQAQDPTQRRGSLSDQVLNQVLGKLEQARAIGLDLYRDFPVSAAVPKLAKQFKQNNRLFAVCKSSDRTFDPTGTTPPPEVPTNRLGFSDFLEDEDGILRRQILFVTPDAACPAPYALSTQLALQYLEGEGITAHFTPDKDLQLGTPVFRHLERQSSGYQTIDPRGSQILLNYRSLRDPTTIAPQVSLTQLLNGKVDQALIRNRIVLIGSVATSDGDYWSTPYGASATQQVPGIVIQAQMVSQILSAVLNHRPLIWVWSGWIEGLWIWIWAMVGAGVVLVGRSPIPRTILSLLAIGILIGASQILLWQGGWVPLVPAAISGILCGSIILFICP